MHIKELCGMYMHEVYTHDYAVGVSHSRLVEKPSGLLVVEEFGRSWAARDPSQVMQRLMQIGLVPPPAQTEVPTFNDASKLTEAVQTQDLGEFVREGVTLWRRLHDNLGQGASPIGLAHAEIRSTDDGEHTTESGLIVVEDVASAIPEFAGFVATAREIEALDEMVLAANQRVASSEPTEAGGLYL